MTIPFDRLETGTDAQAGAKNAQVDVQAGKEKSPVNAQAGAKNVPDKENKPGLIVEFCQEPRTLVEIAEYLGYKDRRSVRRYLNILLAQGRIAMTVPDKPNSKNQKYVTIK